MDIEPVKRRGRPRKSVVEPEIASADEGPHGKPSDDRENGGRSIVPTWNEVIDIVQRLADERKPHLPCKIEHPEPLQEVFYGLGYGAQVCVGEEFRVLFSDGTWVSP